MSQHFLESCWRKNWKPYKELWRLELQSKLIGKVIFHDSRTLKSKLNLSQSLKFQAGLGTMTYFLSSSKTFKKFLSALNALSL